MMSYLEYEMLKTFHYEDIAENNLFMFDPLVHLRVNQKSSQGVVAFSLSQLHSPLFA